LRLRLPLTKRSCTSPQDEAQKNNLPLFHLDNYLWEMSSSSAKKKKNLGSFPSTSVIFSITLALFVIGLFGILIVYSGELERVVRESFSIQVFLKNDLSDSVKSTIKTKLQSQEYVSPGSLIFISKDEARKKFTKETGEDFSFLGENLLRETFQFGVPPVFQDSVRLSVIKSSISKLNGVFQVYYVESSVSAINENKQRIGLVLMGIALVLFIVVVLLINNTLRLALFSQRFLIRSMQLVGATRGFIKKPFLLRALLYGFVGGLIASALLAALLVFANKRIPDLATIQNNKQIMIVFASLTALGIFVTLIGTYRAVTKYLELSLDELY
jgi:cell division transport system permease protein